MTMGAAMHYCLFDTDLGACGVAWSERGPVSYTHLTLPTIYSV